MYTNAKTTCGNLQLLLKLCPALKLVECLIHSNESEIAKMVHLSATSDSGYRFCCTVNPSVNILQVAELGINFYDNWCVLRKSTATR